MIKNELEEQVDYLLNLADEEEWDDWPTEKLITLICTAALDDWETIAGHIKHLICMYDHVNDDPHKVLSDINNILDDAFGHMPTALDNLKERDK